MANNLLSVKIYETVLQNRFKTKNVKFINADLKPISEDVEGFLGEHYNLHINYNLEGETDTEIFFIKIKNTQNTYQHEMSNKMDVYGKEIFIYDFLLKDIEKYGYDTSFAAKSYYCILDQALIFENLVQNGYKLHERNSPCDIDKTKSILKALAMFHGACLAYEKTKSKELNRPFSIQEEHFVYMKENFFIMLSNPEAYIMKWWTSSYKTLEGLVDLLPRDEYYKKDFQKLLKSFPFGKVFEDKTNLTKTCGHGDLWSNNLLFKQDETSVKCKLIDFQLCKYFYPSFDVVTAIFFNTTAELRKNYLNELYQYYYDTLKEYLSSYGYSIENIIPLGDFHESIRIIKADAMLQVCACVSVTYLPKETLTRYVNEVENGFNLVLFNNAEMCAEAYVNDVLYKNVINDLLEEFRTALIDLSDNKDKVE